MSTNEFGLYASGCESVCVYVRGVRVSVSDVQYVSAMRVSASVYKCM